MLAERKINPAIEAHLKGKTHVALIKGANGFHTQTLALDDGAAVDVATWSDRLAGIEALKGLELVDVITADQFRARLKDPRLDNVSTSAERKEWLARGAGQGATHMLVVTDTFSDEDYPVFVMPGEDPAEIKARYDGKEMQRVVEAFDLSLDTEASIDADVFVMRV